MSGTSLAQASLCRALRPRSGTVLPRLVHAEYVQDYILRLRFADGAESEIDLAVELHGEVFEPLREKAYFAQVTLHPELRTVVWPNGTDFAPEFLRSALQIAA